MFSAAKQKSSESIGHLLAVLQKRGKMAKPIYVTISHLTSLAELNRLGIYQINYLTLFFFSVRSAFLFMVCSFASLSRYESASMPMISEL